MPEIKPIHRIFANLIYNNRYVMEQVPEQDREALIAGISVYGMEEVRKILDKLV